MRAYQAAPAGAYDIIRSTVPHIHGEGYVFAPPVDIISADYSFRMKVRHGRERCEYFNNGDKAGFRFADLGDRIIFGAFCTDEDLSKALEAAAFKWKVSLFVEGSSEFTRHMNDIASSRHLELRQLDHDAGVPKDVMPEHTNGPEEIIIKTDSNRASLFRLFCRILDESPEEAVSGMFGDYLRRMAFDAIHTLENSLDPVRAGPDHERAEASLRRLKKGEVAVLAEPPAVPETPVAALPNSPSATAASREGEGAERGQAQISPMQIKEAAVPHDANKDAHGATRTQTEPQRDVPSAFRARKVPPRDSRDRRNREDTGLGL